MANDDLSAPIEFSVTDFESGAREQSDVQFAANYTVRKLECEERGCKRDRLLAQVLNHETCEHNEQTARLSAQLGTVEYTVTQLQYLVSQRKAVIQHKQHTLMERTRHRQRQQAKLNTFNKWLESSLSQEIDRHQTHIQNNQLRLAQKRSELLAVRCRLAQQLSKIFPVKECTERESLEHQRRGVQTEAALNEASSTQFIRGQWITQTQPALSTVQYQIANCLLPSDDRLSAVRERLFNSFAGAQHTTNATYSNQQSTVALTALAYLLQYTDLLATCFHLPLPHKISFHNVLLDLSNGSQWDTLLLQAQINVCYLCGKLLGSEHSIHPKQPLANLYYLSGSLSSIQPHYLCSAFTFTDQMSRTFEQQRKALHWEPITHKECHKYRSERKVSSFQHQIGHFGALAERVEDWEEVAMQDLPAASAGSSLMTGSMLGDLMSSATHSVMGRFFQR